MKTCLIALALSAPWLMAAATPAPSQPAASGPAAAAAASAACPARSAPSLASRRATSKARHTFDDGDPCADPHSPLPRR